MRHPSRNRVRTAAALALILLVTACGSDSDGEQRKERTPNAPTVPTGRPDLLWIGDVETGDLSQFKDTPWNVTRGGEPPRVVDDPQLVRQGRYAVRVAIPSEETGDKKDGACCDPRSELEPNIGNIQDGDDLWFGFSSMPAADFPIDADWQVITQWKQRADGSPPVSFKVKDGQYLLSGGAGHPDEPEPYDKVLAPVAPGQWSDWVVHIKFSPEPKDGFVEVWQNGRQVLERFSPESGTMYPPKKGDKEAESYLKTGYYRNGSISRPGVLYFDAWRVGTSREAVALT